MQALDPLLDFSGQVALITGAARGFGQLLAEALTGRGACVVLGDVLVDPVRTVADGINALHGQRAVALSCDVSVETDCRAMVEAAVAEFGQLDIAVNNAGIGGTMKRLTEFTEADLDQQLAVNLKGVFYGMRHQLAQMQSQGRGGAILNVSSMAGIGAAPKSATYAAAKHGVVGLTRTAAFEYARDNIRVNAICPFYTRTDMVTKAAAESGIDDIDAFLGRGTPMRRIARPEEIVAVMLMLLSPGNTFMSGQAIAVDGGSSAI
jgi:NAD(P)-dependent dehydrogenase (short-subunit alcohol dehydrogenase family)